MESERLTLRLLPDLPRGRVALGFEGFNDFDLTGMGAGLEWRVGTAVVVPERGALDPLDQERSFS